MSPTTDLDGSGNNNTCYLLQKLPAELRIAIYELVFSATDNDLEVDLLQATPPEKYLILTCRRIRHEASAMYRSAYQTYWRTTRFVMQLS
ncbi:hypothetical protein CLAFUW4_13974 [Fulvia fulva]|nr:hypothetical protein CLAFUR4_13977 [Fulvia fulva]KAK4610825.1 hypothetical protein CLAFUR0_13981 [Fulvia fulva]WPV22263.1 hypothetical protein CLAFUW4_13974 [Fulvia fulva]